MLPFLSLWRKLRCIQTLDYIMSVAIRLSDGFSPSFSSCQPITRSSKSFLLSFCLYLNANKESRCIMALIRGLRGKCACPKCLIPTDELSDLSKTFELRSSAKTIRILSEVKTMKGEEREAILKSMGLRNIQVRYSNTPTVLSYADRFFRIPSLKCSVQMYIVHCLLIASIPCMEGYSVIIYGLKLSYISKV